jgi:hypothetical protein
MSDLDLVRAEIDRMRVQAGRQRSEIARLQRAGAATAPAEALLHRMLETLDDLRKQRERLKRTEATLLPRKQRGARHA